MQVELPIDTGYGINKALTGKFVKKVLMDTEERIFMTSWASQFQMIMEIHGARRKETFRDDLKRSERVLVAAGIVSAHQIPPGLCALLRLHHSLSRPR